MVSCLDDDNDSETVYSSWGVTQVVGDGEFDYKIVLDDKTILIPVSTDGDYEAEEMDRVKVYFELMPGFEVGEDSLEVNITNLYVYSIKDIVTKVSSDTTVYGSDPIAVYNGTVWQSNNLLNVPYVFDYNYYYPKIHTVNLVYYPDSLTAVDGGVYLELRHNANGDGASNVYSGFCSFNMTTVPAFANVVDSVPYTIHINSGSFSNAADIFTGYYYKPE